MTPKTEAEAGPVSRAIESEAAVKPFAEMSEFELAEWDRDYIAALAAGDDSAAQASLAAGVPIYYAEPETPRDCVIKEYSDGRKELVTFVNGQEAFLRML